MRQEVDSLEASKSKLAANEQELVKVSFLCCVCVYIAIHVCMCIHTSVCLNEVLELNMYWYVGVCKHTATAPDHSFSSLVIAQLKEDLAAATRKLDNTEKEKKDFSERIDQVNTSSSAGDEKK